MVLYLTLTCLCKNIINKCVDINYKKNGSIRAGVMQVMSTRCGIT
jgi:hypothetical protein